MKIPIAFLHHIPNQPLLEGRLREDNLIAETFVRYLSTKDENWPLLFPMVKSVVKAMDALQAFSQSEWHERVKSFIVSGASKRGWTSWLAAAVDTRVKAIAPLAIDTLNMRAQLPRQLENFGAYSEMIAPYTKRALVPMPETPEAIRLWNMVDPWAYRHRLALPKFIINGSNDPYWTTDALNVYWNDLEGDKWVLYVPNAPHDLRRQDAFGADQFSHVLNGLTAFVRHQITDKPMPKLKWTHDAADGKLRLTIDATPPPLGARLWTAQAPAKDFRQIRWTEQAVTVDENSVVGELKAPADGYAALFGELDYEIEGLKYHLSTQIRIAKNAGTKID
jgi:PhoPQ-activated pathogenicity-related protein